jgi:hypothetical protein
LSIVLLAAGGPAQRERAQKVNFPLSVGSLKKYDRFGLYTPSGVGMNRDFSHWAVQRNRGLHANSMSPLTLSVSSHFSLPCFLIRMAADPSCAKQPCIARDGAGSDGGCQGRFAKLVVFGSEGLGDRVFDTPVEPVAVEQKGRLYLPHVLAVRAHQTLQLGNDDPTSHNIDPVPANNRESKSGGAARFEGGRRVCARSDCDSDSGEVQCSSMDARLYRGVQASVLRGDWEGWRIRPEQSAARNLPHQGVAQVGNFDSDGDAWAE